MKPSLNFSEFVLWCGSACLGRLVYFHISNHSLLILFGPHNSRSFGERKMVWKTFLRLRVLDSHKQSALVMKVSGSFMRNYCDWPGTLSTLYIVIAPHIFVDVEAEYVKSASCSNAPRTFLGMTSWTCS